MKKIIAIFIAVCLMVSLCGCKVLNDKVDLSYTTFDMVGSQQHIEKTLLDNLSVNADVQINVKEGFKTYNAQAFDFDAEKATSLFFKDQEVETETGEDGFTRKKNVIGDELFVNKNWFNFRLAGWDSIDLINWAFDYDGKVTTKKVEFENAELSFGSREKAIETVNGILSQLGIQATDYTVYSVNFETIQRLYAEVVKDYMLLDEELFTFTKDDEFYFVSPRVVLPNQSYIAQQDRQTGLEAGGSYIYAVIGNNGIRDFVCRDIYSISGEAQTMEKIVSVDDVLNVLKKDYETDLSKNKYTVNKIELSYLPTAGENQTYVLKPMWIVYITSIAEDSSESNLMTVIDSANGNILK